VRLLFIKVYHSIVNHSKVYASNTQFKTLEHFSVIQTLEQE